MPQTWPKRRTKIIPKIPNPAQPGDYRPITITCLMLRLLYKITAHIVMKDAPLPSPEGVAANIYLVQIIINNAQSNNQDLCLAFMHFKKAFDSVGHTSLLAATRRWCFPTKLTEYISNVYTKGKTNIIGDDVNIQRETHCLHTYSTLLWTGHRILCH